LFNPDFKDMLLALSDAKIDFLLVGAYAVAAHGHPRATGDLDLWVRPDAETAPKVYRVLAEFGAPLHDLTVDDLATPGMVFQIGIEPSRIDILTAISGVAFDDAWENKLNIELDDIKLNVIGRDDLIVNKRACGRPKDIADAETLDPSGS
jgi:predicted nucleotidyltransferase|tara:strand:- start:38 stop:487 length:450 start_codon:yes stop_codon:yes gene_type:complete